MTPIKKSGTASLPTVPPHLRWFNVVDVSQPSLKNMNQKNLKWNCKNIKTKRKRELYVLEDKDKVWNLHIVNEHC